MKFSLDFLKQNKKEEELFLGIFLKEKQGTVFFIEKKGEDLHVFAHEKFNYTNGWDNVIEDVDDTLYKLETQTKKSPEKTIFFIYSHLIDDTSREIKRPFLFKIKELSKNLELKPLGYIECHEGVLEYLQKKDGIPPTATLIEFDHSFLTVFVYKSGKVTYKETVKRTHEVIDDLIPVLEKVKHIGMIPTRVVMYDSQNLGVEAEKVLSYRWSSELFMQIPKVEIVKEHDLINSLVTIFAGQVLPSQKQAHQQEVKKMDDAVDAPVQEEPAKEKMGFVIGGDVGPRDQAPETMAPQGAQQQSPVAPIEPRNNPLAGVTTAAAGYWQKAKVWAEPVLAKMKKTPLPILAIAGVVLIVVAFFLLEFFFHTAQVTVFMPGDEIKQSIAVPVSTNGGSGVLKLESDSTTTDISESKATTGKKDIGEKAKGSVTIYNSSLSEGKSFSSGTTITSSGGVSFVLDSDAKVASASGDATNPTPSSVKVGVTAKEIGPEGNLGADTKFAIDGESAVVIAKNDSAFTGGVKRTVRTVAKADADALTKQATQKAQEFSSKDLSGKLPQGFKILEDLNEVDLADSDFSSAVGAEADTLTLKTSAKITYFSYKQDDLVKIFTGKLQDKVRTGYEINKDGVDYTIEKVDQKRAGTTVAFDVTANQVKKFDSTQMRKDLPGKTQGSLEKTLKDKYDASGLEIMSSHPIPFLKGYLPLFEKNITLKISYL